MQYSPRSSFTISQLQVIDWYDGIVVALVRFEEGEGWFLASLLAWRQDGDERVYALVPIGGQFLERMLDVAREGNTKRNWQEIKKQLARFRNQCTADAIVIRCRELGARVYAVAEMSLETLGLRAQIGQEVDGAISEERVDIWLSHPALQAR